MDIKKCTSCKVEVLEEYTTFKCPECGKQEIVRCKNCRANTVGYTCQCGFTGP